jgi:hypothetical protein
VGSGLADLLGDQRADRDDHEEQQQLLQRGTPSLDRASGDGNPSPGFDAGTAGNLVLDDPGGWE